MPKLKLTAAAVERIKPTPDKQVEYFDALTPGFALRVSPKGAKSWIMFYRLGGKLRRLTIGRFPALSLADARTKAGEAVDQVDNGIDPAREKQVKKRELQETPSTFEAVADLFIERYAKRKKRTWQGDERRLKKVVGPILGHRPISTITRSDIVSLLDTVEDERGVYAANRTLATVRKMLNWAMVERALIESVPIGPGMAREGEKARDKVLTDAEIKSLWEAADEMGWPFGGFFKVLVLTGQRRNEVGEMRWQELDLEAGLWTIPAERTKAGREHTVPLSNMALDILKDTPRLSDETVFTSGFPSRRKNADKTKAVPISGFSKFKARLDEKAKVTGWRLHDVRRTVATNLTRALKIPRLVVSKVLNHAEGGVTQLYDVNEYDDEKREALNAWADRVGIILKGDPGDKVVELRGAK
tara:strand:+ start:675 stop:1919 length:1245 start_codon:yes stop_codon:yes gene_type:complete